jgi:hypothetical protein
MICPFCLATAAIVAGSTAGSGGVAALAGTILLKKRPVKGANSPDQKEVQHGNKCNRSQAA